MGECPSADLCRRSTDFETAIRAVVERVLESLHSGAAVVILDITRKEAIAELTCVRDTDPDDQVNVSLADDGGGNNAETDNTTVATGVDEPDANSDRVATDVDAVGIVSAAVIIDADGNGVAADNDRSTDVFHHLTHRRLVVSDYGGDLNVVFE